MKSFHTFALACFAIAGAFALAGCETKEPAPVPEPAPVEPNCPAGFVERIDTDPTGQNLVITCEEAELGPDEIMP